MLEFKELWKGKFISVVSPEQYEYEAVHENDIIIVLPILAIKSKFVNNLTNYYVAVRKEVCPPYLIKNKSSDIYYYTTITGKIDKEGESPEQTMKREMIEEAGIELVDYTIMSYQKDMPVCKTTDMRAHIYTILVNKFNQVKATGDGTVTEELSKTVFVNLNNMDKILNKQNVDFMLFGGYQILLNAMKGYFEV